MDYSHFNRMKKHKQKAITDNKIDVYYDDNPFSHPTEREKYSIQNGLEVYRKIYLRNNKDLSEKKFFKVNKMF